MLLQCNFYLSDFEVQENTLMKPLNHPLLLFAIQGRPVENIRQPHYKQTKLFCCVTRQASTQLETFIFLLYQMQTQLF